MHIDNEQNDVAARNRRYKMLNWTVHVEKIEKHFGSVCEEAKKAAFFESLYVSHNDDHRQIQLFAGQHPIGSSEVTRDASGRKTGHKLHTEHGAALVLSQSTLGDVAVILYPYASEKFYRIQPHIIWSVFPDPTKITNSVLNSAIRDFFCYLRVSSALFSESLTDRLRIQYLELRSKRYTGVGSVTKLVFSHWSWVFLGAVGSVASIYSVWPEVHPKSALSVPVPSGNNIERAISMAKMEGVEFKSPSASEVVSKFYVRPTVLPLSDSNLSDFALVSVSPFRPSGSSSTFDAGDCRFLGKVTGFDPSSNKAVLSITAISCTNNSNQAFTLQLDELSTKGVIVDLQSPTESDFQLIKDDDKSYSVPIFSNGLVKFSPPVEAIKYVGQTGERF